MAIKNTVTSSSSLFPQKSSLLSYPTSSVFKKAYEGKALTPDGAIVRSQPKVQQQMPQPAMVTPKAQSYNIPSTATQTTVPNPTQYKVPVQPNEDTMSSVRGVVKPPTVPKVKEDPYSYKSLVKRLIDVSAPSSSQKGLMRDLTRTAEGNKSIGEEARRISEQYGSEIARVGQLGAGAVAGNLSTGSNVVGTGNAAIASQSASARMNALAAAQQAALQGTGQQLTGQQQTAGAYGAALGAANTQQGQQITGVGNAAGMAQPVQIAPGSTLSSPITGEQVAGGLGGYANYRTAEQVMGLIAQYPDAGYIYNPSLTPEQNLQSAQQAIQSSPTYQKSTYGVPGQQSVAGATQIQAAQQGYSSARQAYGEINKLMQNADTLGDNVINILETSGINPTDLRQANKTLRDIKRQFSSEQQQRFDTALQEARAAYGGLVNSYGGQTPTNIGEAYGTLLDPNASVGAITAAIEQLKYAGQVRVNSEYEKMQSFFSELPGQGGVEGGGGGGDFDW